MKTMPYMCACLAFILFGCGEAGSVHDEKPVASVEASEPSMQIQYLEIVTPDVASVCATYAQRYGVAFSEPVAELGNARTAPLAGGAKLGVRAPMRETEAPVVRPYVLVDDIAASVKAAAEAGAQIALPPMELPGQGTCAIYILGGIEHGLWQR